MGSPTKLAVPQDVGDLPQQVTSLLTFLVRNVNILIDDNNAMKARIKVLEIKNGIS
jgi:hypothetical protein